MVRRKKLPSEERYAVYAKTDGYCAYCGAPILPETMQVDHVVPLKRGGSDDFLNMMPACRSCNHYKGSMTLEGFRAALERMPSVLMRDSVTYKNAVRFRLVTPSPHKVQFHFEML